MFLGMKLRVIGWTNFNTCFLLCLLIPFQVLNVKIIAGNIGIVCSSSSSIVGTSSWHSINGIINEDTVPKFYTYFSLIYTFSRHTYIPINISR